MIELVMHICLLTNNSKCHDEHLTFADAPVICVIAAQPIIAIYMERRPRWFVKKWTCRPAGQFSKT